MTFFSPPETVSGFRLVDVPDAPWPVYTDGTGPPVLVLQELAGFGEAHLRCARHFADEGFSVWLPVLGGPVPANTWARRQVAQLRICLSREIHLFARGQTSPVVEPLRALARHAVRQTGADGAGVVGMCFSGGFALALAAEAPVLAAVASQPSLPFAGLPFTRHLATDIGLSSRDETCLVQRLATNDTAVYVTRFSDDKVSPVARAEELERRLGIEVDELPSALFKPGAHSVLTYDDPLSDAARERLDETVAKVTEFLRARLRAAGV